MVYNAPNSPIFWIRLAKKRVEEEHGQLQSVMRFTQNLVGSYYAGPKWHYFSCYGVKGPA